MNFNFQKLAIPDVILITPKRHADRRGYFMETYRFSNFQSAEIRCQFVQENEAHSAKCGTLRGLHSQRPPFEQAKLVRVLQGEIFDVAVDLRPGSETYGKWVSAKLTSHGGEQLFVPRGFAHGYCTLKPLTTVEYKCDAYYSPEHEFGINYGDPQIGIQWPIDRDKIIVSERDAALPSMQNVKLSFAR